MAQTADRFHMRTVNGGTPQLVETRKALGEINNAMMQPGKKAVRTMSAIGSRARIEYRDNRGTVELRPASPKEIADWKPEAEQYAPGDTVVVRPEVYNPTARKYRILPEYAGTIVNWTGEHYNVRAANPDHGPDGVRPCRPRELRPAPRRTLHPVMWRPLSNAQKAANILGHGAKWIRHDFQPGQGAPYLTVSREDALNLITEHLNADAKVYPSTEGGVKIEPTTGTTSYWLQPFPTA